MSAASDAHRLAGWFGKAVIRAAGAGRPPTEIETLQRLHETAVRLSAHYGKPGADE